MSRALSLKLRDDVLEDTERILRQSGKARNAYFNEAIHLYNTLWERKFLKKALLSESKMVARDSLEVLKVFERFEEDIG